MRLLHQVKSVGMLKTIVTFYNCSQRALANAPAEKKITWAYIKTTMSPQLQQVIDGKFIMPTLPAADLKAHYNTVCKEIEDAFEAVLDL